MDKLLRTLLAAGTAALLLAACAAPRSAQEDAAVRSVAVVSLLDESGPVRRLGFTVFANARDGIPQNGKLKQVAVETVRQRLAGTRPQWALKAGALDLPAGAKQTASANTAALAALAARLDVDQIFVLEDGMGQNLPGQGVGLTFRTFGDKAGPMMVHAYIGLIVVDRNGKELVRRGATRDNPHMTPETELGLRPDLSNLGDPKVRDTVSQALQRRLKGAIEEAMERAGY
ncbi:hypothetical protein ACFQ09_02850 [Massilia norwichensis]|uniref:Lipoprotein n=1 Tax=Massilia norwichensis TaxID=1442366 RepID=A0ABT2A4M0_9BURK|nr:hypothetical protein [Massilia norwichensis]MCS0589146.1 hypothetical protein [Massilia norwichensis]